VVKRTVNAAENCSNKMIENKAKKIGALVVLKKQGKGE
jgi:hypothetical protein